MFNNKKHCSLLLFLKQIIYMKKIVGNNLIFNKSKRRDLQWSNLQKKLRHLKDFV